ncbi:MAG TPA: hypothetical protein DHW02_05510 [Ktedonobacter sp.]|nr:hypothetical protein [Ktedonobacter sp.]
MIAPELLKSSYALNLNEQQRGIVAHKQGPLRVIAGPGSGKTRSITLLAMNLLLCKDAEPSEIVLCTYTEKAARELQDRLVSIAESVNYKGDLTQMRVGTIHSICQRLISEYPHRVELGNNYETLDEFTQQLFIFEHMPEICKYSENFFQQHWTGSVWEIAKHLRYFFDKIVDELMYDRLVEATRRIGSTKSTAKGDDFIYHITRAYNIYQAILTRTNCIDFAHLQKCAYNLLMKSFTGKRITSAIKYVLVDEYQDINYIQQEIVTLLASGHTPANLCVIGDEDQSLYRFRGASVSNILKFPERFPDCKQIQLMGNYRCHEKIIATCNRWMETFNWTNAQGVALRTDKATMSIHNKTYFEYQAVATLTGNDVDDEAEQVAELIYSLKKEGRISDYSQVALLLRSVRFHYSEAFMKAFEARHIPYHCVRRRTFFDEYEVCLMVGCVTRILHFHAEKHTSEFSDFLHYISECRQLLTVACQKHPLLERELHAIEKALYGPDEHGSHHTQSLSDYFYRLLFLDPFDSYRKEDARRHNLMLFSRMLQTFQQHFRHTAITRDNLTIVRNDFFQRFFCFLFLDENSLDENQHEPAPKDHVQIMTIHQAKGLEFPVVIVGRLDKRPQLSDNKDAILRKFYHSCFLESPHQIEGVDLRRLYYVAFSRAKNLLILSTNRVPNTSFAPLWRTLPAWVQARNSVAKLTRIVPDDELPTARPRYGFTSHIQTYMTCPRRYEFLYEHRFVSSRPANAFFGLLVHQTIERIHRKVLDGELASLDEANIHALFEKVHGYLLCTSMQPASDTKKEKAFEQVLRYVYHNFDTLETIQATELSISVERKTYVLTGNLDVLMKKDDGWEIRDFKTLARLEDDAPRLSDYKQQLYLYAHALEKRIQQAPLHLSLYWTQEERQEDALMHIPYRPEDIQQAICSVDDVVEKISQKNFDVNMVSLPQVETCRFCDVRHLCRKQGIVR